MSIVTQCPRCLKTFVEHVGIHTCTPTNEWLEMEQELSKQKEINAKLVEAMAEADIQLSAAGIKAHKCFYDLLDSVKGGAA